MKMSASQCTTVLSGIVDDPIFCHLCFICESLASQLPNFHVKIIYKTSSEWKAWLHEICNRYNWIHARSPLIWREIGISGTKVKYIGGVSRFWDLLDKYNITSHLSDTDIELLKSDILYAYETTKSRSIKELKPEYRNVTIVGAGRTVCLELIPRLILTKELWLSSGVVINLYEDPARFIKLRKISKAIEAIEDCLHTTRILNDMRDGLNNCDVLIYLDVSTRKNSEDFDAWLNRNYDSMKELSRNINLFAPARMKVLFYSMGPICLCANVLQSLVAKLPKANIVALSAHYGIEISRAFIRSVGLEPEDFGCPPVWGFLGINHFVDLCHMVQKYKMNKRYSTGSLDHSQHSELRWSFYMAHDKDPYDHCSERKAATQSTAVCDILKLWYGQDEDAEDKVTSLGITSDGTFEIPKGLVFSQPVLLKVLQDGSRIWIPCAEFPLPCLPISIFRNLIDTAVIITNRIMKPVRNS